MSTQRFFVGSYTSPLPHAPHANGQGIYRLTLDTETGQLSSPALVAELEQPSFAWVHDSVLYAVSEIDDGQLSAYRMEADGRLALLGRRSSEGQSPVDAAISAQFALCVNYSSGAALTAFALAVDGNLEDVAAKAFHQGHGPNAQRQDGPHPHSVTLSPDCQFAHVADLGIDEVVIYDLAPDTLLERLGQVSLPPGSGPRSLAFEPSGAFTFLSLELANGLALLRRDIGSGELAFLNIWPTTPADFSGDNAPSAVRVSPDGRFVYVANRGHDSVAVFGFDAATASLSTLQHAPTLGHTPRGLTLSPDGAWLLAPNQDSSSITVFRRDVETGQLQPAGTFPCPTPTSLCFG